MATCPFCASQVSADLVTYGGTCPKCFAEVPGEEAPTDPGAEVRAAQHAADRNRTRLRALFLTSLLGVAILCLGIVTVGLVFWPSPEIAELEFDELDMSQIHFVGADEVGEEEKVDPKAVAEASLQKAEPKPSTTADKPKPDAPKPEAIAKVEAEAEATEKKTNQQTPDAPKDLAASMADKFKSAKLDLPEGEVKIGAEGARTAGGTRGPRGLDGPALGGPATVEAKHQRSGGGALDLEPTQGGISRRKPTLTDEAEIRETMASRMRVLAPNLNRCYEKELKANPTLSGRWEIAFVVQKDGRVSGATARGLTAKDPKFESCMVSIMNRWSGFYPMNQQKKVKRTLNFRPR